jgi:hypothetical protein
MATQVGVSPSAVKESGAPVRDEKEGHPRKLRILCVHGMKNSAKIFAHQIQRAQWAPLIDDIAELVFIDAPWPVEGTSGAGGPFYEWYRGVNDWTEIQGLDESTAYVNDYLSLHGPFDGLLGFSQGGVVTGAWMGLYEKGLGGPDLSTIKFMIVVAGGRARATVLQPAYDGNLIQCPSLHFLGDKDFMKPIGEALIAVCKNPVIIKHPFDHVIPKLGPSEGQSFRDFLLKQLQSKFAA